jgi:hypothetical protein
MAQMTKRAIIEQLLRAIQSKAWNSSAAFGGASGTANMLNVAQADMNKAMQAWLEDNNPDGIREISGTLHVIGSLSDQQYEQIMKAIDGEL